MIYHEWVNLSTSPPRTRCQSPPPTSSPCGKGWPKPAVSHSLPPPPIPSLCPRDCLSNIATWHPMRGIHMAHWPSLHQYPSSDTRMPRIYGTDCTLTLVYPSSDTRVPRVYGTDCTPTLVYPLSDTRVPRVYGTDCTLTLVAESTRAPREMSWLTRLTKPSLAAKWRAFKPFYNEKELVISKIILPRRDKDSFELDQHQWMLFELIARLSENAYYYPPFTDVSASHDNVNSGVWLCGDNFSHNRNLMRATQ